MLCVGSPGGTLDRICRLASLQRARGHLVLRFSRVAQLVEQVTVNHRVGGSSPSSGVSASRWNIMKGGSPPGASLQCSLHDSLPHPGVFEPPELDRRS
jgi:hypothetical protein